MSRRARLLVLQPSLQPPGGGNAVAVCALAALVDEFDVTVATLQPVRYDAIARDYGIDLERAPLAVIRPFRIVPAIIRCSGMRGALLERDLLMRWGRSAAGAFDAVLSFNNEIDVGDVPTIQYIHYPWGIWPRPEIELRRIHRLPGLLRAYYALGNALAPVSPAQIARNTTIVNSDWTGRQFRRQYGGETTTIYPPLMGDPPLANLESRADAVLALGTFAPHKRIETIIEIVERVRDRGHALALWIAGSRDPHHRAYGKRVIAMSKERPWIALHESPSRAEVDTLLRRARFGLHAMSDEHFGMAIAEMAANGCTPLVPRDGGQVEIVEANDDLTYASVDDAVAKLARLAADPERTSGLAGMLVSSSARFRRVRFQESICAIVRGVVQHNR